MKKLSDRALNAVADSQLETLKSLRKLAEEIPTADQLPSSDEVCRAPIDDYDGQRIARQKIVSSYLSDEYPNNLIEQSLAKIGANVADLTENECKVDRLFSQKDAFVAVGIGALGASLPNLVIDFENSGPGRIADVIHREQNDSIKKSVEFLLGGSSASSEIDFSGGGLHRYDGHTHDLFFHIIQFISGKSSVSTLMVAIRHLIIDSAGSSGIPVFGSTYLVELLKSAFDIEIARKWQSRMLGFRMTDALASSTTSLLLFGYHHFQNIPDKSTRKFRINVLAHTTTAGLIGVLAAVNPSIAARRSFVNWASVSLATKNLIGLYRATKKLSKETELIIKDLESQIEHTDLIVAKALKS